MKRRPLILASIAAFFSGLFPKASRAEVKWVLPHERSIKLGGKRYVWKLSSPRESMHPDRLAELLDPNRIFPHPNEEWFDTKKEMWVLAKDEPHWNDLSTFKIKPYEPDENGSDYAKQQSAEDFRIQEDFRERRFAEIADAIGYKEIEDEFNYDRRGAAIWVQVNEEAALLWPKA